MTQNHTMDILRDSIQSSVKLGVFTSAKTSAYAHVFDSKLVRFPLSQSKDLRNFNPARLSKDPYPSEDRPRGQDDLKSVLHHRRKIENHGETDPIWIAMQGDNYILLDGAHRIVAAYLENKRLIPAYVIGSG
jgi:hypothetical protein